MDPSPTSTSITHSHVFKSVLGDLISLSEYMFLAICIQSSVDTLHIPPFIHCIINFSTYIFIRFNIIESTTNRYKLILAFAITTSLIGMLDGGLFSTPALVGLSGLFGVFAIKKPFSLKDLLKPSIFIILLIILRISIGIIGTNIEYHEVTFFDEKIPVDFNGYNVMNIDHVGNETIIKISTDRSDKTILNDMVNRSKGKVSGITLSWNIFSWIFKN